MPEARVPHKFDASGTELKRCTKCPTWKALSDFYKQKAAWDGLQPTCKECRKTSCLKFYQENKAEINAKKRKYHNQNRAEINAKQRKNYQETKAKLAAKRRKIYQENKEKITAKRREYKEKNRAKIAAKKRKYYEKNKVEIIAKQCRYYEENKVEINARERKHGKKKEVKERRNKRLRQRRKEDPLYRLTANIRRALHKSLKSAKTKKKQTSFKYISCSPSFLLERLEKQRIERGLSEYAVDHMMPLDSFDLSDPEQLRRAWHFSNLQALLPKDNIEKSNKVIYDMRWCEKRNQWLIRNKDNKGPYRPTALFQSLLLV